MNTRLDRLSAVFSNLQALFRIAVTVGRNRNLIPLAAIFVRGDVLEERQEPVVVLLRDRIELVIVAAGTIDRETEKDLARGGDDVV